MKAANMLLNMADAFSPIAHASEKDWQLPAPPLPRYAGPGAK
jgi:hypothetical protein